MQTEQIVINGMKLWISIEPLRIHKANKSLVESKSKFLIFWKLSKPTAMNYGELVRYHCDNRNDTTDPILARNMKEALSLGKMFITESFPKWFPGYFQEN